MVEFIILGCLKMRDMTGYEIKKTMSFSTTFFSHVSFGSIYPTLKRLEADGLVTSDESTENGRLKKSYAITPDGRKAFDDWLRSPLPQLVIKYDMLVRLFFARNLEPERLQEMITEHIDQLQELSDDLTSVRGGPGQKGDKFQKYTIEFGLDFYAFLMKWFEKIGADLAAEEAADIESGAEKKIQ
ncbi:MAG: PadR family transcriptional regulator [Solirubrobacterales bacterium]